MTQLHEYEAWLDTVDSRFRLEEHSIEFSFDKNHSFRLSSLNTFADVMEQAETLKELVFSNTEGLPLEYMCKRLVHLTNLKSNANIDIEHIIKELKGKWGGFYKKPQ
ncbi:MAG: hypothetical protein ACRCTL_07580 [Pseudomonas sp.]